jgi:hypothetical protein
MQKFKHLMYLISSRGLIILSVLVLALTIAIIYFIVTGFSQSDSRIAIGIAVISTFLAAISSIASLIQATESQRIREDQTRPYVLAYFDTKESVITFVIENIGNSPAINVLVKLSSPPIDFQKRPLSSLSVLSGPISFLAPGKSLKQLINVGFRYFEDNPEKTDISIEYSGTNNQKFADTFHSDLGYLKQATVGEKSIEASLVDIKNILDKLLKKGTSFNPILVEIPNRKIDKLEKPVGINPIEVEEG